MYLNLNNNYNLSIQIEVVETENNDNLANDFIATYLIYGLQNLAVVLIL